MNYTQLVDAVTGMFDNSELDMTAVLAAVETRLQQDIFGMRDLNRTTLSEDSSNSGEYPIPASYRKTRQVVIDGDQGKYLLPHLYDADDINDDEYTVYGMTLFAKTGKTITFNYYGMIDNVRSISGNWILTYYPAVYLSGCYYEGAKHLYEDHRVQMFEVEYEKQLALLKEVVISEQEEIGDREVMDSDIIATNNRGIIYGY